MPSSRPRRCTTVKSTACAIGILCLALTGCAGITQPPPRVVAQPEPRIFDPTLVAPNQNAMDAIAPARIAGESMAAAPPAEPCQPPLPVANPVPLKAPAPPSIPISERPKPTTIPPSPVKAVTPIVVAAPVVAPPVMAKPVVSSPTTITTEHLVENPLPSAKVLEPALDMAALKARLRDTDAIGVFTKIALKNQVDDLMKQFRTHYLSGENTSVASLRQPYDELVRKVLTLVEDSDPSLAHTISGSREALWSVLADPEKFNSTL